MYPITMAEKLKFGALTVISAGRGQPNRGYKNYYQRSINMQLLYYIFLILAKYYQRYKMTFIVNKT